MSQDAITLLKADHQTVRVLFEEFQELGDRAVKSKAEVVSKICQELTVHARIEEEIFYPRAREVGREQNAEVLEGYEEHTLIKELVADLERMTPEDETFDAKVKVLMEQVEHHVEEEETELFPQTKRALGSDELMSLGARLAEAKSAAVGR